ncbi:uncharacterized protein FTJAE_5758 [Fusarium tjaetaba]|uniref:Uncharacterized protein n=1 Tax=Fusarium tjaetaba TaxID=1567544 RepID=A0A8H5RQN7_9HYPO|nr:uncharacterized protein FTJAE_5758 [Fusarium tjaetaba]KAF5637343.1 hypothetical protein FTJAE_5758 [Fusarium tjaetaba]
MNHLTRWGVHVLLGKVAQRSGMKIAIPFMIEKYPDEDEASNFHSDFQTSHNTHGLNDELIKSNGHLAIDNEDLKKKLALAEERAQKYFDFWRSTEEELTKQLELNDELKKELKSAKVEAPKEQEGSK